MKCSPISGASPLTPLTIPDANFLFLEDIISDEKTSRTSRSEESRPSMKYPLDAIQRFSDSNLYNLKQQTSGEKKRISSAQFQTAIENSIRRNTLSKEELDILTLETEAQIKAVEELLESSRFRLRRGRYKRRYSIHNKCKLDIEYPSRK